MPNRVQYASSKQNQWVIAGLIWCQWFLSRPLGHDSRTIPNELIWPYANSRLLYRRYDLFQQWPDSILNCIIFLRDKRVENWGCSWRIAIISSTSISEHPCSSILENIFHATLNSRCLLSYKTVSVISTTVLNYNQGMAVREGWTTNISRHNFTRSWRSQEGTYPILQTMLISKLIRFTCFFSNSQFRLNLHFNIEGISKWRHRSWLNY